MSENSLPAPATAAKPSRRHFWWIWLGVAAFAYLCDQLTKWWVSSTMEIGEKTPVIDGLLQWYHILNSGAAFSIGENFTWVFTIIMAVVSVGIMVLSRKIGSIWWSIGLGLVLGGALGNLTDRLFRPPSFGMGHVVDFISFPNFAIFNMADMAVVGGVIVICLLTLLGIGMDGSKSGAEKVAAETAPAKQASAKSSDEQGNNDGEASND